MAKQEYNKGLTVNEQLFAAGELDAFDRASSERDPSKMIAALVRAGVPSSEAEKIADTVLARKLS